jgi:hypothetical protein
LVALPDGNKIGGDLAKAFDGRWQRKTKQGVSGGWPRGYRPHPPLLRRGGRVRDELANQRIACEQYACRHGINRPTSPRGSGHSEPFQEHGLATARRHVSGIGPGPKPSKKRNDWRFTVRRRLAGIVSPPCVSGQACRKSSGNWVFYGFACVASRASTGRGRAPRRRAPSRASLST